MTSIQADTLCIMFLLHVYHVCTCFHWKRHTTRLFDMQSAVLVFHMPEW